MLNYSEQGRALTLLYGTEFKSKSNGNMLIANTNSYKKYFPCLLIGLPIIYLPSLGVLIALLTILIVIKSKELISIRKQALDFEKDFAAFLVSLAASLRCGNEPLNALFNSSEMFSEDSAVYRAISLAKEAASLGKSEEQVILSFASDVRHPELMLFRSAFLLARAEGASLSTCLERLAKVIRTRQSVRRKIKAAIAMQKFSAYGICAAVIALLAFQIVTSKDQLLQSWNHPLGEKMLMGGGFLILIGFCWMISLTRSRI